MDVDAYRSARDRAAREAEAAAAGAELRDGEVAAQEAKPRVCWAANGLADVRELAAAEGDACAWAQQLAFFDVRCMRFSDTLQFVKALHSL